MPWVRIDDHFDENPKIARVGAAGIAFYVVGLAYCNRNLTDGFIPWAVAQRLVSLEWIGAGEDGDFERLCSTTETVLDDRVAAFPLRPDDVIELLVEAGLWEHAPGGYRIHDYTDFQPTRAEVESERAAKQAAGRAGGMAAAKARAIAGATAGAIAEPKQTRSRTSTVLQAKSKPVPDPVPTASNEAVVARDGDDDDDFDNVIDIGFRERYGTLVTALGVNLTERLADEFKQLAEECTQEAINVAIAGCRSANRRPYPSELRKRLPGFQTASAEPAEPPRAVGVDWTAYEREQAELSEKSRLRHEARRLERETGVGSQ